MEIMREKEWETCAHSAPAGFFSGCRRAASFPFFGDLSITPTSALKTRSQSDSEGLNRCQISLETLRQRPQDCFDEKDEDFSCESNCSSGSDCDDLTFEEEMENNEISQLCEKVRKSVRFADDCGRDLYCIRVMTEPSDYPPRISPSVLRRLRGDTEDDESAEERYPKWKLLFKQPASEYVKFRETLEKDKVSLENVMIKQDVCKMSGTIKVANIAFEKRVFIRYTTNKWQSYMDLPTTYNPCNSKVYDTFTFEMDLPQNVDKHNTVEFCICYVAGTEEKWDSNGGKNYILEGTPADEVNQCTVPSLFGSRRNSDKDDAYKQEPKVWTTFASWKNLSTEGPYW